MSDGLYQAWEMEQESRRIQPDTAAAMGFIAGLELYYKNMGASAEVRGNVENLKRCVRELAKLQEKR